MRINLYWLLDIEKPVRKMQALGDEPRAWESGQGEWRWCAAL